MKTTQVAQVKIQLPAVRVNKLTDTNPAHGSTVIQIKASEVKIQLTAAEVKIQLSCEG
jgi:hypothetical protein